MNSYCSGVIAIASIMRFCIQAFRDSCLLLADSILLQILGAQSSAPKSGPPLVHVIQSGPRSARDLAPSAEEDTAPQLHRSDLKMTFRTPINFMSRPNPSVLKRQHRLRLAHVAFGEELQSSDSAGSLSVSTTRVNTLFS